MTFDTFVGNRKIIDRLRAKLREGRFPHGVIFGGPEGIGKHTAAVMVAKALNCSQAAPADFCDVCSQCAKINASTHPDVLHIAVEEDASDIKISQIRELLKMLDMRPFEGRNKIFIIDPASAMNPAASNALLKGLEEPPDNSFFILITTKVSGLLVTVRSRCQTYNFTPVPLEELRALTGSAEPKDELMLRWSRGSIGVLNQLDYATLTAERARILDFLETAVNAQEQDFREMLAASAELSRSKDEFGFHLEVLGVLLGDLLYLKEGSSERIVNVDLQDPLKDLAAKVSSGRLFQISEMLWTMEVTIKIHANRQILTDALALTSNDAVSKILNDNAG